MRGVRSLMVTKVPPLPADTGGRQRTLEVARVLARFGDVVLCAFDYGGADFDGLAAMGVDVRLVARPRGPASFVGGLLRSQSVTGARFWHPDMASLMKRVASERFDVAVLEYVQLWPYMKSVVADVTVLGSHNVESSLVRSYGDAVGGWKSLGFGLEAAAIRRLERRVIQQSDVVTVVSEPDARRLPSRPRKLCVCPNGWNAGPILPPGPDAVAAFVATMAWAPNVDAAVWLVRRVWSQVRRMVPGARLLLVGSDPAPAVRDLAADDVEVTGRVPDVTPYLLSARVALAPLRAGGGSRLKVLQALSMGRPVVGTSKGLEGFEDLLGKGTVAADDEESLAREIATLLADPGAAAAMGRAGHDAVAAHYGWDRALAPLVEVVEGRVPRKGIRSGPDVPGT